jgi:hypothetical protein
MAMKVVQMEPKSLGVVEFEMRCVERAIIAIFYVPSDALSIFARVHSLEMQFHIEGSSCLVIALLAHKSLDSIDIFGFYLLGIHC